MAHGKLLRHRMLPAVCSTMVVAAGLAAFAAENEPTVVPRRNPARPPEPAKLEVGGATAIGKRPESVVKPASDTKPELPPAPPAADAEIPTGKPTVTQANVPAATSGGGYILKYKYETNQVTYYEVLHKVAITTQKNQTSETAKNESTTTKHYRVISVDENGSALLELFIDKVKMSAQFAENDPISFDSESKDDPPPQFENVRQSVGKPLARTKVSPYGEIQSVVRLTGPAQAAADSAEADAANNFLIILPNRPIHIGESWNDKVDVKVFVAKGLTNNVTILRNYELKSVNGSLATINVSSTVLTPVRDPKVNGQLIQRTPSGTITFDIEKGAIVARQLNLDKTEIGVFDENSSMRVVGSKVEKLVPRDQALRTAGDVPPKN